MADIQLGTTGNGLAFGIPSGTTFQTSASTSYTYSVINRYDHTAMEFDEKETIDPTTGEVVNVTRYKFREKLVVEAKPSGNNKSLALNAFIVNFQPTHYVTFSAANDTRLNASVWWIESVTRAASEEDHLKLTFNLKRYTNNLVAIA